MAKIRKGISNRFLERPYTRISRLRKLNYVRARPNIHVVKYDMGDPKKKYTHRLCLNSKADVQIRHNALEAGRKSANRLLETQAGKNNFWFKIRVFPHQILRENPMATGAGADRMSEGMKRSFGKPIGTAARVKKGQTIVSIDINENHLETAKLALKRFSHKLPISCGIVVTQN